MRHQSPYRRPTVIVGVALALVMAVTGILAPRLAPHDPNATNASAIFCPPVSCESGGRSHVLGTDHLGRDVLTRIVISFGNNPYTGLLGSLLGLLAAWLLIVVRSMRTIGPDPNMMRLLLGVPYYGVAILTYLIGVSLSTVVIANAGHRSSSQSYARGCFRPSCQWPLFVSTPEGIAHPQAEFNSLSAAGWCCIRWALHWPF